jgi:hypothetical protein
MLIIKGEGEILVRFGSEHIELSSFLKGQNGFRPL